MFKDVLNHMAGASNYASIGLVIFFVVFIGITVNALTRSKRDVAHWSTLPLEESNKEPRS